jgi:integrase
MASIRTRPRKDGQTSYTVTWRDPEQGIQSRTYDDEDKAKDLKAFLDGNRNSFAAASESKRVKDNRIPTVSDLVTAHIDGLTKPSARTIRDYRRAAEYHIHGSRLGGMAIDKVDRADVVEWLQGLTASSRANQATGQTLSLKSRKNVHSLISAAFSTELGQREPRIRSNPAKGISEADTYDAREPVYLSPEDLDTLASEAPEHWRLFLRFLGKTGLRYSEATALRKRDLKVQGDNVIVHVTRAWKRSPEGQVIGPPKTRKAKRTVACGKALSAELVEHITPLALDDLVFTRPDGSPAHNHMFHKEVWQPLTARLIAEGKLDRKPWIHEIRHAHTTHLLQAGRPVQAVQARLGHEDATTTLRVYARITSTDDLQNAAALD